MPHPSNKPSNRSPAAEPLAPPRAAGRGRGRRRPWTFAAQRGGPDRRRQAHHAGRVLCRGRRRRPDGAPDRAALAEFLGQTVLVDNKPGAGGQIAATQVARAVPDGTQLLVDASSFAVNPALYPKLPYDTDTAFAPLAVLAQFPNVLVCTPGFEAKSVKDLIRLAKARPGQIAYASSGNGSAQHLAGALFEDLAGVKLVHVPYRGGGPAMNDVMAGQVPLFFANVASSLGQIQSGRLRPLAVTSRRRTRSLPDMPTMEEAGVPAYEVLEWNPVLAPAGIDAKSKAALIAAIRKTMADPKCWAASAA